MITNERKIKQGMSVVGLLPAFISLIIFAITAIFWDLMIGLKFLGIIMIIYALFISYSYIRTKHTGSLVSALYMISLGTFFILFSNDVVPGQKIELATGSKLAFLFIFIFFFWLLYLMFTRKLKWRGTEILELAAQNIEADKGSFTERPLPIGKIDYSKNNIIAFSKFFEKNLLGLTYWEKKRIVFVPIKYKKELSLLSPRYNYLDKTWVAFSFDGNVSVNVSKEDYLDYKEDLAFDHLCKSLSNVMIEFIHLYSKGQQVRIIDKMNNLKINIFS
ncbi:MAG: hypothetical protein ABFS35_02530 [Bacteroidota bacterium]